MCINEERRRNRAILRNRRYVESGTSLVTDEAHTSDQSAENSPEESGGEEPPNTDVAMALSVTAVPEQEADASRELPALADEEELTLEQLREALFGSEP